MEHIYTSDITYRIKRDNCQAVLIDVQEKLMPLVYRHDDILNKIVMLIKGLQALEIGILVNEQYPQGLGNTVPEIKGLFTDNMTCVEKRTFSACDDDEAWNYIAQQNRNAVLLFGIETHVCMMQTALDLLDNGMLPIIIADATGSRSAYDRKQAIRRMRRAGAVVTTTEAILFELCRSSKDPAFKTISNLVK